MSIHEVKVIKLQSPEKHPNADQLEIFKVWGYTVITRKGEWKEGDLAAYIEPDYVVPLNDLFSFLGKEERHRRIRAKKLRGIYSYGLLVQPPDGTKEGDNVIELMGVVRWEPSILEKRFCFHTPEAPAPDLRIPPKYDLENIQKYPNLLNPKEDIWVTEKIDGASARYLYLDGKFHVGSRTRWKKDVPPDPWWRAFHADERIMKWCLSHEGSILYGEIYGWVQKLRYGTSPGEIRFAGFDIFSEGNWLDPLDRSISLSNLVVPSRMAEYIDVDSIMEISKGNSILCPSHMREGIVIEPMEGRISVDIGRVKLKAVNPEYS